LTESADYRVKLDVYSGPLDLLLFLIRREEIDIHDIPIARVTAQYVEYVDVLRELDPDAIGEFLVLAATLMEIKSRTLLPRPPEEEAEREVLDPRLELVQQLLAYKKYKDAARSLEDAATIRSQKFAREPIMPERPADETELENLDIWDLFDAFNKLLKQIGKAGGTYKIDVDDTPVALHAEDIMDSIEGKGGNQLFEEVFTGRTRGEMIGLFLALLELIRQRRVRATQERPFGPITLELLDRRPLDQVAAAASLGEAAPFAGEESDSDEAVGAVGLSQVELASDHPIDDDDDDNDDNGVDWGDDVLAAADALLSIDLPEGETNKTGAEEPLGSGS